MQKPVIKLTHLIHKNQNIITLAFEKNAALYKQVRQLPNLNYSKTYGAWYLINSSSTVQTICTALNAYAFIDVNDLKHKPPSLQQKPQLPTLKPSLKLTHALPALSAEKLQEVKHFKQWLQSKRYSPSTVDTYIDALKTFLRFYNLLPSTTITNQHLIEFNNDYILKQNLSSSFQNQIVNAVKLFFSTMQNKQLQIELIHRPKNPKVLPNVLSKEEVKAILSTSSNIKHKTMLSLIYSCGLRRGELLKLQLTDIDSKRHLVIIKQGKGRKDRIVPLSTKILELLREYYKVYTPKHWLFEGQDGKSPYDERSLQNVLKKALERTKINKPVTLHWLRHSYATHLLENGTDLRYIQEILGHSSSRTTEIYTHVSTHSIQKIISPFDSL